MKRTNWVRGLCAIFSFFGALFISAETVAESSTTYANMFDSLLGGGKSIGSASASAFMYNSDFENTKQLFQKRKEVGIQFLEEGSVLLKNNDNALPLKATDSSHKKVTVLGTRAFTYKPDGSLRDSHLNVYGGICGSRIYQSNVTNLNGMEKTPWTLIDSLSEYNIDVNPKCAQTYANKPFTNIPSGGEASGTSSGAFEIGEPSVTLNDFGTEYNDAVIVFLGRASGEGRDYLPGKNGVVGNDGAKSALDLSNNEKNLIEIAKQISSKIIVVLNTAIPMEIEDLKNNNDVDSILWIGLPGAYGMLGVAKLINGDANPSGGLSDAFACDNSVAPASYNFGLGTQDGNLSSASNCFIWNDSTYSAAYNQHYVVQAEGIYTGYRYYETRYADAIEGHGNASSISGKGRYSDGSWKYQNEVSYTFGYGLSYSSFEEEFVQVSGKNYEYFPNEKLLKFKVKVTNTGSIAGKHSVQLYAQSPYTEYDKSHDIEKSAVQLIDFSKTKILDPGASETLELEAPLKYLASYDSSVSHNNVVGGYILEDGNYYFGIGNGAHEALNNILVNKNETYQSSIYSEEGAIVDKNKATSWNPRNESSLSILFNDTINSESLSISENGVVIQNQLQECSYNYYFSNHVKYLSRNSWSDFVSSYPHLNLNDEMKKFLGTNAVSGHVYKTSPGNVTTKWDVDHTKEEGDDGEFLENMVIAQFKGRPFDYESWDYLLEQITFDEAFMFAPDGGSFCNPFTKSINSPKVVQADGPNGLTNYPLGQYAPTSGLYSVSENDPNKNILTNDMCCEPIKAATFNKVLLFDEGVQFGENAIWCRTPIIWAPGCNLHRCAFNSRNHEYYSEDPMLTNIMSREFVSGGLEKGAILSPKHFAFNSQEDFREGLSQFFNEQYAREMELRAFQGSVEDVYYVNELGFTIRGSLGMMTSFSRTGVSDANNNTKLMKNILRDEWGFKGLISTDYVSGAYYFNPLDCVHNNVTFMASGNANGWLNQPGWNDYNKAAVMNDPIINNDLKDNMHYYCYSIANSSALNGYDDTTIVEDITELRWWQKMFYVFGISGLVIGIGGIGVYAYFEIKRRKDLLTKGDSTNEN